MMKDSITFSESKLFNIHNKNEPGNFLNKLLGYNYVVPINFYNNFINSMNQYFKHKNKKQLQEIVETNKSCNRKLYWQIIYIPPYKVFNFHVHPNVEYEYVVEGTFYQIRCKDDIVKNYCNIKSDKENINISHLPKNRFYENFINQGDSLINEAGSIHLSFTKSKPCILYSLWSKKHANIVKYPPFLINFNPRKNFKKTKKIQSKSNKRKTRNNRFFK